MSFHVGIDLGGTNIKVGLVDDQYRLLDSLSAPTRAERPAEQVCDDIVRLIGELLAKNGLTMADVADIGAASPGTINPVTGYVAYANNLGWRDFPFRQYITDRLQEKVPVHIENDANVAALAEFFAGSAKGADSVVVITLGTGVGGGAIIHSKMITGHYFGGGEFGHMVIRYGGRECTCGRKGCFESYASATGLIAMTREEMDRFPDSLMWKLAGEDGGVSGKTAFAAMKQGDAAGARVVDEFISYLACGLVNIINALQPEVLSIGGGICKEGDTLMIPLREKVYAELYGGPDKPHTDLRLCTLGNDAGMIGAALLGKLDGKE